ncbi:hypothetical protein BpHYR1_044539 [Brachionus plicatilis]|uniref:Uncharacterized protein n=1 Tax=Brachionus plicatilis TaxID=10195 RepID=A0A3M7P687_BRAPC|nr:hypothetical protein BpHYR1_044539 [Brachionus plicatilis]
MLAKNVFPILKIEIIAKENLPCLRQLKFLNVYFGKRRGLKRGLKPLGTACHVSMKINGVISSINSSHSTQKLILMNTMKGSNQDLNT